MKKALLIGIDNYRMARLFGCVNDMNRMRDLLTKKCGFTDSDLKLLPDVTKTEIVTSIRNLVAGAKADDHILLYMSGNGTTLLSRPSDGSPAVPHEAFCPVDFDRSEASSIYDTEFESLLSGLPKGVIFTWVLDCCFSGGMSQPLRNEDFTGRDKFIPPLPDISDKIFAARQIARANGFRQLVSESSKIIAGINCLFLAACDKDSVAKEHQVNGKFFGVLTDYLVKVLEGTGRLTLPMTDVVKEVARQIKGNGFKQVPQLLGDPTQQQKPFLQ